MKCALCFYHCFNPGKYELFCSHWSWSYDFLSMQLKCWEKLHINSSCSGGSKEGGGGSRVAKQQKLDKNPEKKMGCCTLAGFIPYFCCFATCDPPPLWIHHWFPSFIKLCGYHEIPSIIKVSNTSGLDLPCQFSWLSWLDFRIGLQNFLY